MSDEPREWEGGAFDPQNMRVCSILPDVDADEGYCVRHERDMKQINPVMHTEGALYTTEENFSIYSCPTCLREVGEDEDVDPMMVYKVMLAQFFDKWDDGNAEGDWFRYLGEGTLEDIDGATWAAFGGDDD